MTMENATGVWSVECGVQRGRLAISGTQASRNTTTLSPFAVDALLVLC